MIGDDHASDIAFSIRLWVPHVPDGHLVLRFSDVLTPRLLDAVGWWVVGVEREVKDHRVAGISRGSGITAWSGVGFGALDRAMEEGSQVVGLVRCLG